MNSKKKYIIIILVISLLKFLISYRLPSFYISNLVYDDRLMVSQLITLISGKYLGAYSDFTLIKGIIFPLFLFITKSIHLSYSSMLSILYILSCLYFVQSFDKVISNKKVLIIFYAVLLFNPISFSSELFQRLYRNSLSSIELLFFLGTVIRLLLSDSIKKDILYSLLLGVFMSIMYMTREDNIWTMVIVLLLIGYKIYKQKKIKYLFIGLIPILLLQINLNIVSFINYKAYGIYTYNEIQKSSFKNTFKKILQIKDDKEINQVSVQKSTLYKLADYTDSFGLSREDIDIHYKLFDTKKGEIYNGNIIWYFRQIIQNRNKFKSGKEEDKYYKKLGKEIDLLFQNKKLKKEFTFSSILMNRPTRKNIKKIPKSIFDIILYTTTYKDIKTITNTDEFIYDSKVNAFAIVHRNSHTTAKIVSKNDKDYEMIRLIYMILAVVLTPISIISYFVNIKKIDTLSIINHFVLISYLIILAGVAYTNVTAFPTIRYLCLDKLYILQSIFVLITIYQLYEKYNNKNVVVNTKKKKTSKK